MDDEDKQIIIEDFNHRYKQFGHSNATLGWTKGKHELRYYILLSYWNLKGKSVLDFGCGFGDMYKYLKKIGLKLDYFGIDINPILILEGKKSYPDANLECRDVFQEGLSRTYDYIISSGVHNFKLKDNWSYIQDTFELYNKYSINGFALNFLSNRVDYVLEDTYHSDPVRILELAYKYSNRVSLRNDYMPFEFTIFIDKQNKFDTSSVVYPEFIKYITEN